MTTYPHRYGDSHRAVEHYATACVASAKILRSEGETRQAADLEAAAERALDHLDHRGYGVDGVDGVDEPTLDRDEPDRSTLDRNEPDRSTLDRDDPDLSDPDLFDDDGQVPRWWR